MNFVSALVIALLTVWLLAAILVVVVLMRAMYEQSRSRRGIVMLPWEPPDASTLKSVQENDAEIAAALDKGATDGAEREAGDP